LFALQNSTIEQTLPCDCYTESRPLMYYMWICNHPPRGRRS